MVIFKNVWYDKRSYIECNAQNTIESLKSHIMKRHKVRERWNRSMGVKRKDKEKRAVGRKKRGWVGNINYSS